MVLRCERGAGHRGLRHSFETLDPSSCSVPSVVILGLDPRIQSHTFKNLVTTTHNTNLASPD